MTPKEYFMTSKYNSHGVNYTLRKLGKGISNPIKLYLDDVEDLDDVEEGIYQSIKVAMRVARQAKPKE